MTFCRISLCITLVILCLPARRCRAGVQEEAEQYVRALRADTADPSQLSMKIFKAAESLKENAPLRLALFEKAYEEGFRTPEGQSTAMAALEALIAASEPKNKGPWQEKLLNLVQMRFARNGGAERSNLAERIVDLLVALAESQLASGQADQAHALCLRARETVQRERTGMAPRVADVLARCAAARKVYGQLTSLRARLKADPSLAQVRTELIRTLVVELDGPSGCKELLVPDLAEQWRTYVPLAAGDSSTLSAAACAELGHWYWEHVQVATALGRPRMENRAYQYYKRFLAIHEKQDANSLTAKTRLTQLAKWRAIREKATFGMVNGRVTEIHEVGHSCQVWQILPDYAVGTRYSISVQHAAAGPAGGFFLIAFADTTGDGRPDKLIGMSPPCIAFRQGQWSTWEFQTPHKTIFVGNCWKKTPRGYYHSGSHPQGYTGLSGRMYVGRSPSEIPTQAVMNRYVNIRVDILE